MKQDVPSNFIKMRNNRQKMQMVEAEKAREFLQRSLREVRTANDGALVRQDMPKTLFCGGQAAELQFNTAEQQNQPLMTNW
jgi:hypothetical protein